MSLLEKTEQSNSPAWSADTNPQSCSSAFGLGTRSGIQAATRTLFDLLSYDEPRPKLQVLGRKATTLSSGQCFAECCRQHWKTNTSDPGRSQLRYIWQSFKCHLLHIVVVLRISRLARNPSSMYCRLLSPVPFDARIEGSKDGTQFAWPARR